MLITLGYRDIIFLNWQQLKFCWIFAITNNISKSARIVRYEKNYAYKLTHKRHIMRYIDSIKQRMGYSAEYREFFKWLKVVETRKEFLRYYKNFNILKRIEIYPGNNRWTILAYTDEEVNKILNSPKYFFNIFISDNILF